MKIKLLIIFLDLYFVFWSLFCILFYFLFCFLNKIKKEAWHININFKLYNAFKFSLPTNAQIKMPDANTHRRQISSFYLIFYFTRFFFFFHFVNLVDQQSTSPPYPLIPTWTVLGLVSL